MWRQNKSAETEILFILQGIVDAELIKLYVIMSLLLYDKGMDVVHSLKIHLYNAIEKHRTKVKIPE